MKDARLYGSREFYVILLKRLTEAVLTRTLVRKRGGYTYVLSIFS